MRLRQKSLLVICLTLAGLMAFLCVTSNQILLNSYSSLEEQEVGKNIDRAKDAFAAELNTINATAGDYAGWDDAYAFIENANKEFIKKNLADSAFANLKISLMLFVNSSGHIVYAKSVNRLTGTASPFPQSFLRQITPDNPLVHHRDTGGSVSGIVTLPEGILLLASRPILTSEFRGPVRGSLIVGRFLDAQEIDHLQKTTHLSLMMLPLDHAQKRPDLRQASSLLADGTKPLLVRPINSERIAGYTVLKDVYGKPALLLRVETARDILGEGRATIRFFMLSWILIGTVFAIVFLLLLDKLVISRLGNLSKGVADIGIDSNFTGRVSTTGNDEIRDLACAINGMLDALSQAQANLKFHALEADAANQELESFCYSVSHDLRAPLRHINGFSQALIEDCLESLDEQGRSYLRRICAATDRMGALIDDLLDLSRVSRKEMRHETVNLTEMACSIMEMFRDTAPLRKVAFKSKGDIFVTGDRNLLRLVMENLLGNAWKYTSKKDEAVIEFDSMIKDGEQIIFVRDDGVGFDMAYCDKLFMPFQRLHNESEFEGTGIGLATVQRIINRHGGRIWAEGDVGKGAVFYFTLPLSVPIS
ncbi:CHASE4 domain-containing protein [Geotalea sp. SG265]|uniref:CHASE4 domain-containing protein n=1 Tax=Geotalea sp. SG265 TaxID=2922867 RepID=UPI001FAEB5F6|nr:CHASE4 domain-containing protein [Geotalea sp. SG265]